MSHATANLDPTRRFSTRVEDYVKYRPSYPPSVVDLLTREADLTPETIVADVGAGTGISSTLLLALGCTVYAVEPNREMRMAAEQLLAGRYPSIFRPVAGRAEATTLPDGSVDLAICAQAFHWFDRPRAATELRRILRPGGHVAVLFNERNATSTPFLAGYEDLLLRFGTDYKEVAHGRRPIDTSELARLFGGHAVRFSLPNAQTLDWEGLRGRLMSASYTPLPGQPGHTEMLEGLRALFDQSQVNGVVQLLYETEVFVVSPGRLTPPPGRGTRA